MSVYGNYLSTFDEMEKTYRKEKVRNIVRDVDGDAHVSEMEAVAQTNQCQRHNMMQHQLLEVLPRLLQQQDQHEPLLRPVTCLQEIVGFKPCLVCPMREPFIHALHVEEPDRCPTKHIQPYRTRDGEVHGGIELFQEPALLPALSNPTVERYWLDEPLHQKLPRKREDDSVEGYEAKVLRALAVLRHVAHVSRNRVCPLVQRRVGVGEEEEGVEWVALARSSEIV